MILQYLIIKIFNKYLILVFLSIPMIFQVDLEEVAVVAAAAAAASVAVAASTAAAVVDSKTNLTRHDF
jgi:hypothetical protein